MYRPGVPRNDPDDPLKQCNVRLPTSLVESIDARRAELAREGTNLSRDVWIERALRAALRARTPATVQTAAGRSLRRIR